MADLIKNNALTEASQQLQAQLLLQQQQQQQPLSWYSSFLSFVQGFLLGQASVVLLVFVFLKYFVFGDAATVRRGRKKEKDERRIRGQKQEHRKGQRKGDRRKGRSASVSTSGSEGSRDSNSRSSNDEQGQSSPLTADAAAAAAAASVLRSNRPLSAGAILDKTYFHTQNDPPSSMRESDDHSEHAEYHQKHHHHHQGRRKHYRNHNQNKKTHHNHHDPESLDWFNVLVAQTIARARADACSDNILLVRSLTEALNGDAKPGWMDEIRVTEMSLGEEFPIFRNCRIVHGRPAGSEGHGNGDFGHEKTLGGEREEGLRKQKGTKRKKARKMLQAHMDVELKDAITLGLETKLVLNYPRPLAAMLPVGLVVEVVRFEGTLSVSFDSPSPDDASPSSSAPRGNPTASNINKQPTNNHNNHNQCGTNQYNNRNNTTTTTTETQTHSATQQSSISAPSLYLNLTFLPDYTLDLAIRSQLGSRSRIQDIPKIAQLVEQRLLAWFEERFVAPRGGLRMGVPRMLDSMRMERG